MSDCRIRRGLEAGGQADRMAVVCVTGEAYSGRRFLVRSVAARRNRRLLMADAAFLGDMDSLLMQLRKSVRCF